MAAHEFQVAMPFRAIPEPIDRPGKLFTVRLAGENHQDPSQSKYDFEIVWTATGEIHAQASFGTTPSKNSTAGLANAKAQLKTFIKNMESDVSGI